MKGMKLSLRLLVLALGLFVSSAIFAQDEAKPIDERMERKGKMPDKERHTSAEMVAKLTEKMKQELTLTDEQTAKVTEINKTFAAKREAAKGDKEAMKVATTTRLEAIKSVLTEEQISKFKENNAAGMDKMKERRGKGEKPNRRGK
jgi:Spy/CpxP family protein refolding chaperone